MHYAKTVIIVTVTLLALSGCCSLCQKPDQQQQLVQQFDDYMIPLARAVDAIADTLPPNAQDQAVLSAARERSGDPLLLKPFEGYVLKARIQDGVGVILLCSPDGREAIIEDVSCTTRPDSHRPIGSPCTYLLDVKRVCVAR